MNAVTAHAGNITTEIVDAPLGNNRTKRAIHPFVASSNIGYF